MIFMAYDIHGALCYLCDLSDVILMRTELFFNSVLMRYHCVGYDIHVIWSVGYAIYVIWSVGYEIYVI